MHGSHDHTHSSARRSAAQAGISLLRLSAAARLSVALVLSALIWVIVYFVVR
jgi:hypothetical protein